MYINRYVFKINLKINKIQIPSSNLSTFDIRNNMMPKLQFPLLIGPSFLVPGVEVSFVFFPRINLKKNIFKGVAQPYLTLWDSF